MTTATNVFLVTVLLVTSGRATAQETKCRSYYVGDVLYTTCNGQPAKPALDPSIPLRANPPPKGERVLDTLLKLETLRELERRNKEHELPEASPPPLERSPSVTSAPRSSPSWLAVSVDKMDGKWWTSLKRLDGAGDLTAFAARLSAVRGIVEGITTLLMMGAPTYDEYVVRRDRWMRTDLTYEQTMTKIDGYYAEPGSIGHQLGIAVITVLKPPQPAK